MGMPWKAPFYRAVVVLVRMGFFQTKVVHGFYLAATIERFRDQYHQKLAVVSFLGPDARFYSTEVSTNNQSCGKN